MAREQMRWWGWAWGSGGEQGKQTEQLHQPPLSYVTLGGRCHHGEYPHPAQTCGCGDAGRMVPGAGV